MRTANNDTHAHQQPFVDLSVPSWSRPIRDRDAAPPVEVLVGSTLFSWNPAEWKRWVTEDLLKRFLLPNLFHLKIFVSTICAVAIAATLYRIVIVFWASSLVLFSSTVRSTLTLYNKWKVLAFYSAVSIALFSVSVWVFIKRWKFRHARSICVIVLAKKIKELVQAQRNGLISLEHSKWHVIGQLDSAEISRLPLMEAGFDGIRFDRFLDQTWGDILVEMKRDTRFIIVTHESVKCWKYLGSR